MRFLTKKFWTGAIDRSVSTAAQSVLAVIAVDQVAPNAFDLDYKTLAGVAAGGALLALLKAFAVGTVDQAAWAAASRHGRTED